MRFAGALCAFIGRVAQTTREERKGIAVVVAVTVVSFLAAVAREWERERPCSMFFRVRLFR